MKKLHIFCLYIIINITSFTTEAYPLSEGFLIKNNADKAIIPFRYIDDFIVLPVRLNHGKTLNIILDTGIRSIVIFNKKTAYKHGLFEDREVIFSGAGLKNSVEGFVTNQVIVSLPQVQAKGISIVTLNKAFTQLNNMGIDGAMGYQIFSRFIVEIDYKNQFLVLHNDKKFKLEPGFEKVPISIEDTRPYVNARVSDLNGEEQNLKFMIDTGFNNEMILFKNHKTHPAIRSLKKDRFNQTLGKGLAGTIKGRLAHNFNFCLQNILIKADEVFLPNNNVYELDDYRDGTIGNKTLSQNLVIIDYINEYLYIRPHYYRKSLDTILASFAENNWF